MLTLWTGRSGDGAPAGGWLVPTGRRSVAPVRKTLLLALLLTACGGSSSQLSPLNGSWVTRGSMDYFSMALSVTGTNITGFGNEQTPGSAERTFTVSGTTEPVPGVPISFQYDDGTTEGFTSYTQASALRLTLQSATRGDLEFWWVEPLGPAPATALQAAGM